MESQVSKQNYVVQSLIPRVHKNIYFSDGRGGGGGREGRGSKAFFGSEILVIEKGFFWVYKRCRDIFGLRKNRDFLGIVFFISSQQ